MNRRRPPVAAIALSLSLSLALTPLMAAAPAPLPKHPPSEDVVPAYMDALRVGDWTKAGGLMHPEALAEMRQVFLALSATDESGQVAQQLFGLKEGETLEGLLPSDLFARFMSMLVSQTDGLKDMLASTRVETLGSVAESNGLAHVVYRLTRTLGTEPPSVQIEVLTVKKSGSDWRSMVPPELQGILASIKTTIAQRDAMLKQMRQQQSAEPFPTLDLTTEPSPEL
jgi:hypothetical protein